MNESITDKMPSGVITVDRDGVIIAHNPASERIFEGKLSRGTLFRDVVRESASLQELLEQCVHSGGVFSRMEFNAPTANGDKRIGINLSPVTGASGVVEGAICVLSDLTEIVELQKRVKLRENFAALGEMSAGIAHEFKNALATIHGYAQMCTMESDAEVLRGYAGEILKESRSLSAVVTDFLNFARPVSAAIENVDLAALLRAVVEDVQSLRPGSYDVSFRAEGAAAVPCDATMMRQTFLNLLINGVEAMEHTGTLSVVLDRVQDRAGNHVRIAIEDTGPGIPAEQLAKIFIPFFTTKASGTGLGLALVQKIVFAHNGRIEVENTEAGGARFTILLPAGSA